ncbi:MAG: thermonuclease family protein [Polyangiales bacterium]
MRRWGSIWVAGACLAALSQGCDRDATAETSTSQVEGSDAKGGANQATSARRGADRPIDREGVFIGSFELADDPVVDGDTIRVKRVEKPLRLLSIDTEERFHGPRDRRAAEKDFAAYLKRKRADKKRPQKPGTPMGEAAVQFAEEFFRGAETVRLQRDIGNEIYGHFGRPLAYASVKKNGRWTSYNIECVRAGMSPYFTKYGYSRRLYKELMLAETEAREAQRGIWAPDAQSYGDYDERKAWWNARADFIQAIEHEGRQRDDYIFLNRAGALDELEQHVGKEVTVLSTIDEIRHFKGLARVNLYATPKRAFPVIFFDKAVFRQTGIEDYWREPVKVRGKVERYEKGDYRTLQIVVADPAQVVLPTLPDPP